MNSADLAVTRFKDGYLCSQSVFSAYCEDFGLDLVTACKIATPFGGGMARMGETCGAVTGALMVIGLKYGSPSNWKTEDSEKEKTYETVTKFVSQFKRRNGTVLCRELLGCDISTPEGREMAKDRDLYSTVCPGFVRDAAEILKEIL